MFQNKLLRRICGPKGKKSNKYRRKLEVRIFIICIFAGCYYADQIKKDEMEGHVERMGAMRNAYKISV
jgi:hypothetical protein